MMAIHCGHNGVLSSKEFAYMRSLLEEHFSGMESESSLSDA